MIYITNRNPEETGMIPARLRRKIIHEIWDVLNSINTLGDVEVQENTPFREWAESSEYNYQWLLKYAFCLAEESQGYLVNELNILGFNMPFFSKKEYTPFPIGFIPIKLLGGDEITSLRNYFLVKEGDVIC